MTVVRVVVSSAGGGWRVAYLNEAGDALAPARQIDAVGEPPFRFPRPPAGETAALEAAASHHGLLAAADEEALIDALTELGGRAQGSVERVGRYLHAVLFGAAWPRLESPAGALRIELWLPPGDGAFGRFPWEIMHDGSGFLALERGVTLLRRVEGPGSMAPASSPLDVLFIVGGGLRDDIIRPAAEYLGLVQSLEARQIDRRLRPRLLLEATTETIAAAFEHERPAVVHFMTHGRFEGARPYLEVRSRHGAGSERLFADGLLELLRPDEPEGQGDRAAETLPIVVLSACETASARETGRRGEAAAPYAASLVAGGVPFAVGMTGPVGDLACRLFTRAFYSALLEGADAAAATAAGRRAAVVHGGYDATSAYDWALPTLFLSSAQDVPRLEIADAPLARRRQKLARELEPGSAPVFCDRLSVLAAGEALLTAGSVQKRLMRGPERQTLAISTEVESKESQGEQLGRTWVLRAIATRAALSGHVPILVSKKYLLPNKEDPGDWPSFARLLYKAMQLTRLELGLEHRPCAAVSWLLGRGERPPSLPDELAFAGPDDFAADDMAVAMRFDLLELLEAVRRELPEPRRYRCRLLLLIDDLHRMGELATDLLGSVFGPLGLRVARRDLRVVFSWVRKGQAYQSTIRRIVDWLGEWNGQSLELERFQDLEERLAYQHFLFHYETPLTVASGLSDEDVEKFYGILSRKWQGVPSNLRTAGTLIEDILAFQESGLATRVLVPASDEDVVERWLREEDR